MSEDAADHLARANELLRIRCEQLEWEVTRLRELIAASTFAAAEDEAHAPGERVSAYPMLSADEGAALAALARNRTGREPALISIAHARFLALAGLAERSGSGWVITAAGKSALDGVGSQD
ncbi:MAG: hypothetical protein WA840_12540 [Caulobacteraceae bacterium]